MSILLFVAPQPTRLSLASSAALRWVERLWKHWLAGWALFSVFFFLFCYWLLYIPPTGYAIAAVAVAAAVMAARLEALSAFAKFLWVILLFLFMIVEMRAIRRDRVEAAKQLTRDFARVSKQAEGNLRAIIGDEQKNFSAVTKTQQRDFANTTRRLITSEKRQNIEFGTVLKRQQGLFEAQREFSEFLSGKLLPADDPMPRTKCSSRAEMVHGDVAVFVGSTVETITNKFPHTILQVRKRRVIYLDRTETGSLVLSLEMRDAANRLIARVDRNGFVVSSAYDVHLLRPDKSTVIIDDEFGNEMVRARFLNPKAFSISGVVIYGGTRIPLNLGAPGSSICMSNSGVDISID